MSEVSEQEALNPWFGFSKLSFHLFIICTLNSSGELKDNAGWIMQCNHV